MHRHCRVLIVILALSFFASGFSVANAQSSEELSTWTRYAYPADGFSIAFPASPKTLVRKVPTTRGVREVRFYILSVAPTALSVVINDYSDVGGFGGVDPDTLLQGAKNGALGNSGAREISEKKISLDKFQGLAFEGETDRFHISARTYMVDSRLYMTQVVSPLESPYAETDRFHDSFRPIAST